MPKPDRAEFHVGETRYGQRMVLVNERNHDGGRSWILHKQALNQRDEAQSIPGLTDEVLRRIAEVIQQNKSAAGSAAVWVSEPPHALLAQRLERQIQITRAALVGNGVDPHIADILLSHYADIARELKPVSSPVSGSPRVVPEPFGWALESDILRRAEATENVAGELKRESPARQFALGCANGLRQAASRVRFLWDSLTPRDTATAYHDGFMDGLGRQPWEDASDFAIVSGQEYANNGKRQRPPPASGAAG